MPTAFIAAQSTDMQYIILFSNTSNRQNKRRFRSVDTVLKTSHVVNFRQASWRGDNDESLGIKHWSSITHPLVSGWGSFGCCKLTCRQTRISLWEHPLWKRAPLVFGMFSIDMSFTSIVDCNSSMLQAGVDEPNILPKMILLPEWHGN